MNRETVLESTTFINGASTLEGIELEKEETKK